MPMSDDSIAWFILEDSRRASYMMEDLESYDEDGIYIADMFAPATPNEERAQNEYWDKQREALRLRNEKEAK